MLSPTAACTRYVIPPHVRVRTPSNGTWKMISGEAVLSIEKRRRKVGSSV